MNSEDFLVSSVHSFSDDGEAEAEANNEACQASTGQEEVFSHFSTTL
jgi:hypothetical protein